MSRLRNPLAGVGFMCPGIPARRCPLNAKLCTGFGMVTVRRAAKIVWQGDPDWNTAPTLMRFEYAARKQPRGPWTVHFLAPYARGQGFA